MRDVVFVVPRDGVGRGEGVSVGPGCGRLRRPRAFVYGRCALSDAVGAQVDACLGASASGGFEVVGIHVDTATSGLAPGGGPALRGMMDQVRAGATEAVVVAGLDRLSRDFATCSAIVDECLCLEVSVLVVAATAPSGLDPVDRVEFREAAGMMPCRAPAAMASRGRRAQRARHRRGTSEHGS